MIKAIKNWVAGVRANMVRHHATKVVEDTLRLAHAKELSDTPGEQWPLVRERQAKEIAAVRDGNLTIVDRRSWQWPYLPSQITRVRQPIIKAVPYNIRRMAKSPVPRRAINLIKNAIISLEWDIVPINGTVDNADEDVLFRREAAKNCFNHPNMSDSYQSFMETGIDDMLTFGVFCAEPQLTPDPKRPIKMWVVDSSTIRIFPTWKESDPSEPHYAQMTGLRGERGIVVFYDDELMYLRDNPIVDSPFGLGKMEIAFQAVNALLGVQEMSGKAGADQTHRTWLWWETAQAPQNVDIIRRHLTNDIEGQAKINLQTGMKKPDVIDITPVSINDLLLPWQEMLIRMIANAFDISAMAVNLERDVNRSCYSEDTETLTKEGWKKLSALSEEDLIGAFNPHTRRVEFVKPKYMHVSKYKGDMLHFSGKGQDILVTPDHRMYARKYIVGKKSHLNSAGNRTYQEAHRTGNFYSGAYKIEKASDLESGRRVFASSFLAPKQVRKSVKWFTLPGCTLGGGVLSHYPDRKIKMDDWLSFLGFFISEGHAKRYGQGTWKVNLCQSATVKGKQAICLEMDNLISRLPFAFKRYVSTDGICRWQVADKSLCKWLIENCGKDSATRCIPSFVYNLPRSQMKILYTSLIKGDGHRPSVKKHPNWNSVTYHTTSIQLCDELQLLANFCGHTARVKNNLIAGAYRVYIIEGKQEHKASIPSRVPYNGKVYCFHVPPHHLFITRRNGCIAIQGNTGEVLDDKDFRSAVVPVAVKIAEGFTRFMLHRKLGWTDLEFKYVNLDDPDVTTKMQIQGQLFASNATTPNEIRKAIGMGPLATPWANLTQIEMVVANTEASARLQVALQQMMGQPPSPQQEEPEGQEEDDSQINSVATPKVTSPKVTPPVVPKVAGPKTPQVPKVTADGDASVLVEMYENLEDYLEQLRDEQEEEVKEKEEEPSPEDIARQVKRYKQNKHKPALIEKTVYNVDKNKDAVPRVRPEQSAFRRSPGKGRGKEIPTYIPDRKN